MLAKVRKFFCCVWGGALLGAIYFEPINIRHFPSSSPIPPHSPPIHPISLLKGAQGAYLRPHFYNALFYDKKKTEGEGDESAASPFYLRLFSGL
jgi:hypothetical protein